MILEIAVFDFASAAIAVAAGADRIELCADYASGGITVSHDVLKKIKQNISIPVFPIIRPRGGNFVYSDEEFETMKQDILFCKELNYEGVVLGILKKDKTIDVVRTAALVSLAYPMQVTFHRAFDECADPFAALEEIINCGCKRILTSGQKPSAQEGIRLLAELIVKADKRICIMPGGGIRANNLSTILSTHAKEFHSAALFRNNNSLQISIVEIQAMKTALRNVN